MPEPYSISLLNDSFPPLIDGVANTVVNYARELTKLGDRAIVVTPEHPDADDSRFPFPVVRYPSVDTRRLFGYLAGYPFSPETLRQLKEQKVDLLHSHCPVMSTILARSIRDVVDAPLVFTYHTKFDVDVAKLLRGRLLQESALYVLASNISACDEVWVVSHGAGENLRSIGYQGDYQVMENGVDMPRGRVSEEAITAAAADYDLPEGVPVFLFVGRMGSHTYMVAPCISPSRIFGCLSASAGRGWRIRVPMVCPVAKTFAESGRLCVFTPILSIGYCRILGCARMAAFLDIYRVPMAVARPQPMDAARGSSNGGVRRSLDCIFWHCIF